MVAAEPQNTLTLELELVMNTPENKFEQRMRQLTDFGGNLPPQPLNTLSEAELEKVEHELGFALPSEYREFLRHYGNFFVGSAVDLPDPKPNGRSYGEMAVFYGVNPPNPMDDIVRRYHLLSEHGWPPEFLPIGSGDSGDMCLVIRGDEKGAVYFWEMDIPSEETYGNFHLVARSFGEFMNLL
jgi:hypothetical protein